MLSGSVEVCPLDISLWVRESGRANNILIGDIILSEDTDTSLRVIRALAKREDPYMQDIIERLFYQESKGIDTESLLEILFGAILKQYNSPGKMKAWIDINPRAYDLLIENLLSIENPFLKSYILLILPYGENKKAKSILMSESRAILREMVRDGGYLEPGRIKEVLAVFEGIEAFNDSVFSEMCLSLVEKSRQTVVVSRGRSTLQKLRAAVKQD
jgi:hypothetical protein